MSSIVRPLKSFVRVLAGARGVSSDVARSARLMREANRVEITSPARAAAMRMAAREMVLA